MGETLAKPVPSSIALGRTGGGLEKRREVERGRKRDVDIDAGEPGGLGRRIGGGRRDCRGCVRRGGFLTCGLHCRLDSRLRSRLGRRFQSCPGCRPSGERGRGLAARFSENVGNTLIEPFAPPPAAREGTQHGVGSDQSVVFEDRARHRGLVLLFCRQRGEQVMGAGRHIALGIAFEEYQCPPGIVVQQCRGGGET